MMHATLADHMNQVYRAVSCNDPVTFYEELILLREYVKDNCSQFTTTGAYCIGYLLGLLEISCDMGATTTAMVHFHRCFRSETTCHNLYSWLEWCTNHEEDEWIATVKDIS